jgi:G3E family GTPase
MPSSNDTSGKAAVVLLSGFLGAGKTTLLRRVLSWETDLNGTVVIVNEFGEVGIDGALLKDAAGSDMVELTSGCICCTLSSDLKQSLLGIWDRLSPKRVLIESTGVADPTAIADVLSEPDMADRMRLEKTVTVLDADFWEAREVFGPLFYHQLEMADLILLNKIDLVDAERVPAYLKEIHHAIPDCRVVPTIHCRVDPQTLWSTPDRKKTALLKPMEFYRPAGMLREAREPDSDRVDASRYVTFTFRTDRPLQEDRFRLFAQSLPFEVFRMKGPVRFAERSAMVNHVGGKSDIFPWPDEGETLLAFIGWDIEAKEILKRLRGCAVGE